ncbi:peptide MFS transporter [Gordonia phthalatica]|uniref:Major facilitator transporter n=1 Tax=Gordonia phthalatica TaxID=1136941 RepID=A0A0N9MR16_9ACTN|nr:peptide MFS transporter [Gordonia phthalatica]ALG84865.1 major facilitator transporter [Gordonia phthalatica]
MTLADEHPTAVPPTPQRGFFGHPRALGTLFGVEMWERFSFYGMQGILAYYLYYTASNGGLGFDEASATSIVGAYGGLVYLSTIVGSWISDRILGAERTLFYSAVIIMFGHIALALVPGVAGMGLGLILVAFGSGGLKSTATTMVGDLYAPEDLRRDAGFSVYYMGVNLGAFFGPLLTGWAQEHVGFHLGFGLAAIGMFLGLVQYSLSRKQFGVIGSTAPDPLPSSMYGRAGAVAAGLIVVVTVLSLTGVLTASNLSDVVVGITVVAAVGYFVIILTSRLITADERSRVVAFIPLFLASTVFWALFQQQFTTVAVYADKRLDRDLFGWTMPASWVQSINPVFIIVFAGVFAALWTALGSRQPSTPIKFALGTGIMGIAFLCFIPMSGGGPGSAPLLGLAGILLLFTIAELCLSPVGLSLSTKLAPKNFHTQMVALFYLSVALGTALAGTLAKYYDEENDVPYFLSIGLASIGVAVVLAIASPYIRRLMRGVL